jgi:hypothetical protein
MKDILIVGALALCAQGCIDVERTAPAEAATLGTADYFATQIPGEFEIEEGSESKHHTFHLNGEHYATLALRCVGHEADCKNLELDKFKVIPAHSDAIGSTDQPGTSVVINDNRGAHILEYEVWVKRASGKFEHRVRVELFGYFVGGPNTGPSPQNGERFHGTYALENQIDAYIGDRMKWLLVRPWGHCSIRYSATLDEPSLEFHFFDRDRGYFIRQRGHEKAREEFIKQVHIQVFNDIPLNPQKPCRISVYTRK